MTFIFQLSNDLSDGGKVGLQLDLGLIDRPLGYFVGGGGHFPPPGPVMTSLSQNWLASRMLVGSKREDEFVPGPGW